MDEPRATKQIAQPSESGPFENERGKEKVNCMPYPKTRRFSPLWVPHAQVHGRTRVPHAPVHGRTSTALALPVLVCTSLRKKLSSELVAGVSADFLPATNRPQHRRQRCCGRLDLPMLASNPKCWRYQIQARENIPTLSRAGPGSPRARS